MAQEFDEKQLEKVIVHILRLSASAMKKASKTSDTKSDRILRDILEFEGRFQNIFQDSKERWHYTNFVKELKQIFKQIGKDESEWPEEAKLKLHESLLFFHPTINKVRKNILSSDFRKELEKKVMITRKKMAEEKGPVESAQIRTGKLFNKSLSTIKKHEKEPEYATQFPKHFGIYSSDEEILIFVMMCLGCTQSLTNIVMRLMRYPVETKPQDTLYFVMENLGYTQKQINLAMNAIENEKLDSQQD